MGKDLSFNVLKHNGDTLHICFHKLFDRLFCEAMPFLCDNLAGLRVFYKLRRPLTHQELFINHLVQAFSRNLDRFCPVEVGQYIFRRIPKGLEKQSGREFAAAINPDIDHVFWINL